MPHINGRVVVRQFNKEIASIKTKIDSEGDRQLTKSDIDKALAKAKENGGQIGYCDVDLFDAGGKRIDFQIEIL